MNGKKKLSTTYVNQAASYAIPPSVSPVLGTLSVLPIDLAEDQKSRASRDQRMSLRRTLIHGLGGKCQR